MFLALTPMVTGLFRFAHRLICGLITCMRPVSRTYLARIWADELLTPPECRACGQEQWWDNAGCRMCQVCHPDPRPLRLTKKGSYDSTAPR